MSLWIAGSVLAVLVLIILFILGTKLAGSTSPVPARTAKSAEPSARPSATPSTTPRPSAVPADSSGRAAVGLHDWRDLRGGECVDPFTTPYAEKFTVVDCAAPHPAQLVFRGTFPEAAPSTPRPLTADPAASSGFPGDSALKAQINLLCTAPNVIDLAAAGAYTDIQFQAAYAADAAEWKSGQHDYFCFVNRSSGEPITGSVAGTAAG